MTSTPGWTQEKIAIIPLPLVLGKSVGSQEGATYEGTAEVADRVTQTQEF